MMKRSILLLFALALALASWPGTASAQNRRTDDRPFRTREYDEERRPRHFWQDDREGFYLGLGAVANITTETDNGLSRLLESGGGLNLFAGMRFNRYFALELGVMGTMHATGETIGADYDSGILNAVTLDGRVFVFPNSRLIEPFVQTGVGGYMFFKEGYAEKQLQGFGFHVGAGVDFRLSPLITLGLRTLYKGVSMQNETSWYTAEEDVFMSLIDVEANFQIHF
mgnify:CR=1 FL=1